MRKALPIILFFVLVAVIVYVANRPWWNRKEEPHIILISKGIGSEGYLRYAEWLEHFNPRIKCINLYGLPADSIQSLMQIANGLVLSGGPDVYPMRYGRINDTTLCEDFDIYRDSLEYALIKEAIGSKMPILGICRGLQILNVYHGGTLYADLPTQLPGNVNHRCENKDSCLHSISITEKTFFHSLIKDDGGIVNSNHHQGIHELGPGLLVSAQSVDGLPEAIEWEDHNKKGFLLAVQWHPERMSREDPMSAAVGRRFIGESFAYKLYMNKKRK
jgi:putative glutamine amidotransferase